MIKKINLQKYFQSLYF